eukprot:scaffold69_cov248-Pinguiococcus_pyrenoidosus.AAC.89
MLGNGVKFGTFSGGGRPMRVRTRLRYRLPQKGAQVALLPALGEELQQLHPRRLRFFFEPCGLREASSDPFRYWKLSTPRRRLALALLEEKLRAQWSRLVLSGGGRELRRRVKSYERPEEALQSRWIQRCWREVGGRSVGLRVHQLNRSREVPNAIFVLPQIVL